MGLNLQVGSLRGCFFWLLCPVTPRTVAVSTWPSFPSSRKQPTSCTWPIWAQSGQIKAQGKASDTKSSIIVAQALPSQVVFGLIPGNGDKSCVNLGHAGTVTNQRHRLCVLRLLLTASPSSGCEKWFYSSGMHVKKIAKRINATHRVLCSLPM